MLRIVLSFFICLLSMSEIMAQTACVAVKNPDKAFRSQYIKKLYPIKPMGLPARDRVLRSRKFGIPYHSNGFEYRNACVTQARINAIESYISYKIAKENPDPQIIEEYRSHAYALVNTPRAISDIVDRCFAKMRSQWKSCGGKYAQTARLMTRIRKELKVQVMPAPFWVTNSTGGSLWAAGMASNDQRSIFASVSMIGRTANGGHFTHSLESLVCWEMGNLFGTNHGKNPHSLAQEVGFQIPCQFYKNN